MTAQAPVIRPRSWSTESEESPEEALGATSSEAHADASSILASLEEHVVGQRHALGQLSLLLAMHALGAVGQRSPNAIVLGPTGVGKTHSLAVACQAMHLPFVTTDATSLVPSGIVGEAVEDVLERLVDAADAILGSTTSRRRRDDDAALARRGIILVDEFDKLAAPDDVDSSSQAMKRVVQRRLLKLTEGATLRIGTKRHEQGYRDRFIDTSGILLIVSGAFSWLSGPVPDGRAWRGIGSRNLTSADLVTAGFLPELIGRLPVLIGFEHLSPRDLVGIIDHEVVSPLGVWRRYLDEALDADLELDQAAKWVVAERASELDLGARGLAQVLFPVLADRASQLVRSESRQTVMLGASDFSPETTMATLALPVQ